MISKLLDDPTLCALLCDSSDSTPYQGIKRMLAALENTQNELSTSLEAVRFAPPPSSAKRHLHQPCPGCGSRMVRSRDLRDMCVVCGYLQAQA